jgi:uncharacterized protein (UPF0332 family)
VLSGEALRFLAKAEGGLAGAESEFAAARYNNCANRAYYAAFQAAVAALLESGLRLPDAGGTWAHGFVQAQFAERLIKRRKRYPARLRDVLTTGSTLRHIADYDPEGVSQAKAALNLRVVRDFVTTIAATEKDLV